MDHEAAIRLQASERYLLGELSPSDRDEFEEHYFTCMECAEDVRAAVELRANARAVFREKGGEAIQAKPAGKPGWLQNLRLRPVFALSAALNVALFAGIGIQSARVARLTDATRPQFYPTFFVRPPYRAEIAVHDVPRGARLVGLYFELKEQERRYARYAYQVSDSSGREVLSGELPPPEQASSELNLVLPTGRLNPGVHTFIFSGVGNGQQVELRRIRLRIQQ
jgi:Putative zinc-finger